MANKKENNGSQSLHKHTEDALKVYFQSLNGDRPGDLYELVIGEVERPLFKAVLDYTARQPEPGGRHTWSQSRHATQETALLLIDSIGI